jgi:phage tail-like protein
MTVVFNWYGQPDQPPTPAVLSARAVARRTLELELSELTVVREKSLLVEDPADRYTPVTWPGETWAAANPENYVITRPEGGNLDGAGEAVDLVATHAEEAEGYWSEATFNGTTYIVATRVWVHTDFQHTPRADYHVVVSNIRSQPAGPPIEDDEDEADWAGYIVSQVQRNSLVMYDSLPRVVRRLDEEGTGDLLKFLSCLQEVWERVLEDTDAFFAELCEIDRMRPEFLDALLYDLGDPLGHLFDLTTNEKRKLAAVLVQMYREKGTCEGVVNVVRFFTGIQLSGCTRALEGNWRLHGGSYPTTLVPPGGPYKLGTNTILGPGTAEELWSFWLLYPTPGSLTADELAKIAAIVDYMKPAGTHYLGVKAP